MMDKQQDVVAELRSLFNNVPDLITTVRRAIDDNAGLRKQLDEFKAQQALQFKKELIEKAHEVKGIKVIQGVLNIDTQNAKDMAFQLRGQFTEKLLVVIGGLCEGKPSLTVSLSDDLVAAGLNAGKLVREAGRLIQGGGGGQAHFATAGGKDPDGIVAAVTKVIELATAE
jgi:alanyl-tRNA synthetase